MIREIRTLWMEQVSIQYYMRFGKDRKKFGFQPTLKNKDAPSFNIFVRDDQLEAEGEAPAEVLEQAMVYVREVLDDSIFDQL
jgi:hypothetical protein